MSALQKYIESRQSASHLVYMPYITLGDPDFEHSVAFAIEMIDAGAPILELGIPFSDPTADGPVIQAAMVRSIARQDFSLAQVFECAGRIHRARPAVPLVFLTYLNPVMSRYQRDANAADHAELRAASFSTDAIALAMRGFLDACQANGVRGLVIPDLPFDAPEAPVLRQEAAARGIDQIQLIAPNTSAERLHKISKVASGFIYYVTSLGVTGMRTTLPPDISNRVQQIKAASGVPVLAGFGISQPEQVKPLRDQLDGVIVGSRNQSLIAEHGAEAGFYLSRLTSEFVQACL
ncbi:MAG: tryptophan synthase subunit alpha [Leptospiraceae bacterium]|nr:tryptophan synthase subunit alpha [Leptospiraceae bacterium]